MTCVKYHVSASFLGGEGGGMPKYSQIWIASTSISSHQYCFTNEVIKFQLLIITEETII